MRSAALSMGIFIETGSWQSDRTAEQNPNCLAWSVGQEQRGAFPMQYTHIFLKNSLSWISGIIVSQETNKKKKINQQKPLISE